MKKRRSHSNALRKIQERGLWNGSFNSRESTLHQLSPYVGKLKTGLVSALIEHFTTPGQWVCDPFSGSGVVPLQSLLLARKAAANDLSIYAYCLTRGKMESPATYDEAVRRTERMIGYVAQNSQRQDLRHVDKWVRIFFHPRTLKETLAAFEYCRWRKDWFLAACLCGILHHQRPGFLSYPASHLVPYLRSQLFPRRQYPELYEYRPLAERIRGKVKRAFLRPKNEYRWARSDYDIHLGDARALRYHDASMDLVLTSPPYYNALDYARDNRLRLWFLNERDWRGLDSKLTLSGRAYEEQMRACLREMGRVLKRGKYCVLVLGDVRRGVNTFDTSTVLGALAYEVTKGGLSVNCAIEDHIPDNRRSRRGTNTTRIEKILVLQKNF